MHVSELFRYPVKSLRGERLDAADLDEFGVVGDRRWMVVDREGRFLTQRELPQMSGVQAHHLAGGLRLTHSADRDCIEVSVPSAGADIEVRVWRDLCHARLADSAAHSWLSAKLRFECRLVFMPSDSLRVVDPAYGEPGDRVAFADGFPLLLIGTGSLQSLNERLQQPVTIERFRPNVVVLTTEPHVEDRWHRVALGGVECAVVKPCSRCSIPRIDPETGVRGPEPMATLGTYRRDASRQVLFGQNLIHRGRGAVRLGDPVRCLA